MTSPDPLIDEVRTIRAQIAAEFGNDVERLCAHLREVEREYESRTGRFADLTDLSAEQVVATWQADLTDDDPLIDDVRALRRSARNR